MPTEFTQNLIKIVRGIPAGKVMSYGQVAAALGRPRAAREVGWALQALDPQIDLPWWRVVNNAGVISIKGNKYVNKETQKELLEKEGLEISKDFTFDIEKYRFRP